MPGTPKAYAILERVFGRHLLWRVGRWLYMGARRELSATPETDGEVDLQGWAIAHCRSLGAPPVIWDVGANLGHWSRPMARQLSEAGLEARLVAFEPAPQQRAALGKVEMPKGVSFEVSDLALGAAPGAAKFQVTGDCTGTSALATAATPGDSRTITVTVATVDALMPALGINRIALLKIDTEGNDFNVLKGARAALRARTIDLIQFEYGHHWINFGHTLQEVMSLAHAHGYRFGRLTPGGVEIYEHWHHELDRFILANYVLISPEVGAQIPQTRMRFDGANVAVAA